MEPLHSPTSKAHLARFHLVESPIAVSGCYFVFGWNQAGYVAGELNNPRQTLPRTVTISVLSITLLYVLLNMAFVHHLGFEYLQQVGFAEVGTLTAKQNGGEGLGWWMNLLILFGLVGSLNGTILCGARVGCSMAKEASSTWFSKYSNSDQPVRVLIFQAVISIGYILTGTFEQLLELVSLAMILVAVVTASGVCKCWCSSCTPIAPPLSSVGPGGTNYDLSHCFDRMGRITRVIGS